MERIQGSSPGKRKAKKKGKKRAIERPRSKGIHINSSGVDATMRVGDNEVESNYATSDELHKTSESDGEELRTVKKVRFPNFNADRDMKDPTFSIGILFTTKEEFKEACKQWGIRHRF